MWLVTCMIFVLLLYPLECLTSLVIIRSNISRWIRLIFLSKYHAYIGPARTNENQPKGIMFLDQYQVFFFLLLICYLTQVCVLFSNIGLLSTSRVYLTATAIAYYVRGVYYTNPTNNSKVVFSCPKALSAWMVKFCLFYICIHIQF